MSETYELQHLENMRVAQAKIHEGDTRWYIVTANGYVVRGPFGSHADNKRMAEQALERLRQKAREEINEREAV